MRDRILEIPLDVHIPFTARNDATNRTHFQEHPLKIEEAVTAKHSLAVSCKDAVQIAHREFMSQFGQAATAGLLGVGVNQIKRNEDLPHHEIFHRPDAVDDSLLANREMS